MRIRVRLFATLRSHGPQGQDPFPLELPQGASVDEALKALGIPPEIQKVILVNGRHAKEETLLEEEDSLTLFPPVEGG